MQISVSISSLQQQNYKLKTWSEVPQKLPSWSLSEKFTSPLVRSRLASACKMAFHTPRGQKASAAAWDIPPHLGSKRQHVKLNMKWSKLSMTSPPLLLQGKSYFCTWEIHIYSRKHKTNSAALNSSFWVHPLTSLFVQELGTWDWPQCSRTRWCEIQQRSPVRSWSSTVQKHTINN